MESHDPYNPHLDPRLTGSNKIQTVLIEKVHFKGTQIFRYTCVNDSLFAQHKLCSAKNKKQVFILKFISNPCTIDRRQVRSKVTTFEYKHLWEGLLVLRYSEGKRVRLSFCKRL